jgi:hypothetical protein
MYDLDKTQAWLERTIQLNKKPPVRGGVEPDVRLRRQTAGGVSLVAVALFCLTLLPRPEADTNRGLVRSEEPTRVDQPKPQAPPKPLPPVDPVTEVIIWDRTMRDLEHGRGVSSTAFQQPDGNLYEGIRIRPGAVPPPAPIFLDGEPRPSRR